MAGLAALEAMKIGGDADPVDDPAQNADGVELKCATPEVVGIGDPRALYRVRHQVGVEKDVGNEAADAIHQYSGVGSEACQG